MFEQQFSSSMSILARDGKARTGKVEREKKSWKIEDLKLQFKMQILFFIVLFASPKFS